ncbi:MAG: hypothetical protein BGO03_07400 [Mesorhizobium sp. 61-13]|nr:hypothetical protein [Mesorhizobium sp.]OJU52116.1 MAG: hypothetical protein BGO03_07400 [Mesorhizobium sp. 61-13]
MAAIDWSQMITAGMKAEQANKEAAALLDDAVQNHLDEEARAHGYRDGSTLASYAGSTMEKWRAEATTFIAWRDSVWLFAQEAAATMAREPQRLIAALPPMKWPSHA